ncbi:MAG TPA: hypothetical protein VG426_14715 [Candidatus Dormibacteraeota bacterium]|nr:hypothetical protein [Candidatus Dormibacteraeota bacterium]
MGEQPAVERTRTRTRYRNRGCGCGFGGFFLVLTVGIVLSLFNTDFGVGISVRVPFTESNVTLAGSIGAKGKAVETLPSYTSGRLGGNQNFFNNSTTTTIGPAEGAAVFIIGRQDDAPAFDVHIEVR